MYGLVNRAVRDLVILKSNLETWNEICEEAGIAVTDFTAMDTYPDAVTYDLVRVISSKLNMGAADVLRAFGRHWILYTAKEGYGEILSMFGQDFETCVRNLNSMHARMGAMMPHLVPPRFVVTKIGDSANLRVEYHSKRLGLGPMVLGLLEGLAERFMIQVEIEFNPSSGNQAPDLFDVKKAA